MPSTKYPGLVVPRGIDPDIAGALQLIDTTLRGIGAGSGPADALAFAGGQVSVGTGPAPTPGAVLTAQTVRTATWAMAPGVAWSWMRVTATAGGATLVYSPPSGWAWVPQTLLVRARTIVTGGGANPTLSFGITGGAYADVLAATALNFTATGQVRVLTIASPASLVNLPLWANISVASTFTTCMLDVYGLGIIVPA